MNFLSQLLLPAVVLTTALGLGWSRGQQDPLPRAPQVVLTGRVSEIAEARYVRATSQAMFDSLWIEHMGDRVRRASQGWPMTPQIDFRSCYILMVFAGDSFNANGMRVMELHDGPDALHVRFERISYQTSSSDGRDHGEKVRPWAVIVVPHVPKDIVLEENVQGLLGGEPKWKARARFEMPTLDSAKNRRE